MSRLRRLPKPLRQHLAVVALPAGTAIGAGLLILGVTMAGAREARAFERGAERVVVVVVGDPPGQGAIEVRLPDGQVLRAPTVAPDAYDLGEEVAAWYADGAVRLATEPYDAASPAAFGAGLVAVGSIALVARLRRIRRLQRLAASHDTAFSFVGEVVEHRSRLGIERPWLELRPLDQPDGTPVAALPLLRGQVRSKQRADALVRGVIADRAVVVATFDGHVVWPSGELRVGRAIP